MVGGVYGWRSKKTEKVERGCGSEFRGFQNRIRVFVFLNIPGDLFRAADGKEP